MFGQVEFGHRSDFPDKRCLQRGRRFYPAKVVPATAALERGIDASPTLGVAAELAGRLKIHPEQWVEWLYNA